MLHHHRSIAAGVLCALTVLLFSRCVPPIAGTATETENITGKIYQPDGKTPATGAIVYLLRSDFNPYKDTTNSPRNPLRPESTTTDGSGIFVFDSIPDGYYNVLASENSNYAFQDSIIITANLKSTIPDDTLKAPGGLCGVLQLEPNDNPSWASFIFWGTSIMGRPENNTGKFQFLNLPEGSYRLTINIMPVGLVLLNSYHGKDTTVNVVAGKTDTVMFTFNCIRQDIKKMTGIYSPQKNAAIISWYKPDSAQVLGYKVYRRNLSDSSRSGIPLHPNPITDTFYIDPTGIQGQTYEYCIAAVYANGTEGDKSKAMNVLFDSFFVGVDVDFSLVGIEPEQIGFPFDMSVGKNNNIYMLRSLHVPGEKSTIQIYDSAMRHSRLVETNLRSPAQLCIDDRGFIYVLQYDTVFVFDSTISAVDTLSQFTMAYDIDVGDGSLYLVTDTNCITVCSTDGTVKRKWKVADVPYIVPIVRGYSDKIFALSPHFNRLFVYDTLGNSLATVSLPFRSINSMAVDKVNRRIYFEGGPLDYDEFGWSGSCIFVLDDNYAEIARYKITTMSMMDKEMTVLNDGTIIIIDALDGVRKLTPLFK